MRPIQYFSDEYLAQSRKMTPTQVASFLEDGRTLFGKKESAASTLISLRVPDNLLATFRAKCELDGVKYQRKIKDLMVDWLW